MRNAFVFLLVTMLLAGCANGGGRADADGDGLTDAQEADGHTITITFANGTTETREVASDPHHADADGDGLDDPTEYAMRTDPNDADTDRDGLLDGHNVTLDPDSARAVMWRSLGIVESPRGTFVGELDASSGCTLKGYLASSDLPFPDKLSDGVEVRGWNATLRGFTRHVTSDPCSADTDRDGLPDDVEHDLGTDPRSRDTDGDGAPDGADADPLWDLGLALENATSSASGVTILALSGAANASFPASHGAGALPVDDSSSSRTSLVLNVILSAKDADGHAVDLFGDARGTYVTLDVLAGTSATINGVSRSTQHLSFSGADGTLSLDWRVTRT